MRQVPASVLFLLLLFGASPAWAEESEYEPPAFGVHEVILDEESAPEGWTATSQPSPEEEKISSEVEAQGDAAGVREDLVVSGVVLKDAAGGSVTVVLVDVEVDPKGLSAALKASAEKNGWTYRELGSPGRIVLAAGPPAARETVVKAQVEHAVEALVRKSLSGLDERPPKTSLARRVAEAALAIEPKSGRAAAARAMALQFFLQQEGSKDPEAWKDVLATFEKAFAPDAVKPPTERLAALTYGHWGFVLLSQKTPGAQAKAKEVLTKAVELEKHVEGTDAQMEHSYNLVCALSLLGEKEEAIRRLDAVLAQIQADGGDTKAFVAGQIAGDHDLDPIRGEPAFAEMLKKYS
jgi:hypothetical protein